MTRVRQLLIGLASSSVVYSGIVPALGLGEITLHSALSQPLDAEIELLEVADLSANDLKVGLAPVEAFNRSGVDRLYFLNDLRFTPVLRGGKSVIRVVSNQPVREPYLNFIVEVARPNGRLLREYTLLIDPPNSSAYRAVARVPEAQSRAPQVSTAATSNVAVAPRELPTAVRDKRYRVSRGDSLWTIAAGLRAAGSTVSQQRLMSDIHALNPQAFSNGDIDRLKAGADLLLPDVAVADKVPSQVLPEAMAEVQSPASPEQPLDTQAELIAQVQRRVDQELASQAAENLELQQRFADMQLQLQQLQAQMSSKDQQLAELQAELAARQASTAVPAASAAAVKVESDTGAMRESAAAETDDWLRAGFAGLLLAVLGLFALFWAKKRRVVEPDPSREVATEPFVAQLEAPVQPLKVNTLVADEAESTAAPMRAASPTDALEGANIYIAYGRFSEAAASLRKALTTQPERSDIRFRLLEVLAQLGDAQAFAHEEAVLRDAGFTAVRIEQLKARHPGMLDAIPVGPLDAAAPSLEEVQTQSVAPVDELQDDDFQLNLDDLSLDADWDLVSPFPTVVRNKKAAVAAEASSDSTSNDESDTFDLTSTRDVSSPFAESMLVEETSAEGWLQEELNEEFLEQAPVSGNALLQDLDHLAGSRDNLAKLNQALAYIEQGSVDSACNILNQVINDGDEQQKQEARELLAKIA
ncbi:pilus assembly protein FimV [Pseudomonas sp. SJZ079]|uniref:FimV/HubP family polar landmark protein n=1 Tax=Pseudomonas sp. SJZ079 TaxID=2572887 RepID=UPI00119C16C0|nr:FimV/HubP family polar landmark protein [Pseudomonas sp. SJZ079]TWC38892.1 pilus assembly protein FimV [Pseudomonas sp. SJZ079]